MIQGTGGTGQNTVLWRGHPSLWNFAAELILGALLLPLGIGLLIIVSVLVKWKRNRYVVSTSKVGIQRGLFVTSSREVRPGDIRSITIVRRGLGGLLGFGSIEFSSAAHDSADVVFYGVASAEAVADLVRSIQNGSTPGPLNTPADISGSTVAVVIVSLCCLSALSGGGLLKILGSMRGESVQTEAVVTPPAPAPPEPTDRARAFSSVRASGSLAPPPTASAPAFRNEVAYSQRTAVGRHPDLGRAGSPLNTLFLARLKLWQAAHDPRLNRANWPVVLADDCQAHP